MKYLIAFVLTALLSFAGGLFFPWWIIAITAFVVALVIPMKPGWALLIAFLSLMFLWGGLSMIISLNNKHLLASKVAAVLPLGGSAIALIMVTAIVGGLVAGLAALSGSLLRRLLLKAK